MHYPHRKASTVSHVVPRPRTWSPGLPQLNACLWCITPHASDLTATIYNNNKFRRRRRTQFCIILIFKLPRQHIYRGWKIIICKPLCTVEDAEALTAVHGLGWLLDEKVSFQTSFTSCDIRLDTRTVERQQDMSSKYMQPRQIKYDSQQIGQNTNIQRG